MKKGLLLIALAASASLCYAWGTVGIVSNQSGGAIHLTDRVCNNDSDSYGFAYSTGTGNDLEGCWTVNRQGNIAVHWWPDGMDDFWRVYPRSSFDVTAYGRANGWD